MRRFWKTVSLVEGHTSGSGGEEPHLVVQLDSRSLRTPSGSPLQIPYDRPLLASLIAKEWDEQDRVLQAHALPLVSMLARVEIRL